MAGEGRGRGGGEEQEGMSKNARKKLAKRQYREQKRQEKKERQKAARQEEKERKAREAENLTDEDRQRRRQIAREKRLERQREQEESRQMAVKALQSEYELAFDFRYWHRMDEREQKSLAQQLSFLYGVNKRSQAGSFRLHFTSFDSTSRSILSHHIPISSWHVVTTEEGYAEHFRDGKKDVVYLSADSPNELEDVSPSEVYVIGCFVDRSRAKNVSQQSAAEQGVRTARLPLHRFKQLGGDPILTVNQVVELLIALRETGSWRDAIERAIPPRKLSQETREQLERKRKRPESERESRHPNQE